MESDNYYFYKYSYLIISSNNNLDIYKSIFLTNVTLVTEQKILPIYLCPIIKNNHYEEHPFYNHYRNAFDIGFGFWARYLDDFQKRYWSKSQRQKPATPDCKSSLQVCTSGL